MAVTVTVGINVEDPDQGVTYISVLQAESLPPSINGQDGAIDAGAIIDKLSRATTEVALLRAAEYAQSAARANEGG